MKPLCALPLSLLPLAMLALSALPACGETLTELQMRWGRHLDGLRDLEREERVARSREFFDTVSWQQLRGFCFQSSLGPDENRILGGLVNSKLRAGGAEPKIMAAMIADPGCQSSCQEALVKFISQHRDSVLRLPEAQLYGDAMLSLADSGERSEAISWKLEEGAATLSAAPRIMSRMMRYGRSVDERTAVHGVRMLSSSRDAAAPDSLLALARELQEVDRHAAARRRAALGLAPHCDEEIWAFLEEFYRAESDLAGDELPREALIALANTQDPRSYPIFLANYGDSEAGIADSTNSSVDSPRRRHYYNLWFFTRLAEPGIIRQLETDGEAAPLAVELLDRASRFGLPASREELLAPLEAWGERRGDAWQRRAVEIAARFRAYPEPGEKPLLR